MNVHHILPYHCTTFLAKKDSIIVYLKNKLTLFMICKTSSLFQVKYMQNRLKVICTIQKSKLRWHFSCTRSYEVNSLSVFCNMLCLVLLHTLCPCHLEMFTTRGVTSQPRCMHPIADLGPLQIVLRNSEHPPLMKGTSWTLASPFKEQKYHRSPSESIANNYTPTAANLKMKDLPKITRSKTKGWCLHLSSC